MYKKLIVNLLVIALGFNLVGCAVAPSGVVIEEIEGLAQGSTLWGIQQALRGEALTFILRNTWNPNLFMIGWPIGSDRWGFVLLDAGKETYKYWGQVCGNFTTPRTMADLVEKAVAVQFANISASEASVALGKGTQLMKEWIEAGSTKYMPTIVIVPVGVFDFYKDFIDPLPQYQD